MLSDGFRKRHVQRSPVVNLEGAGPGRRLAEIWEVSRASMRVVVDEQFNCGARKKRTWGNGKG